MCNRAQWRCPLANPPLSQGIIIAALIVAVLVGWLVDGSCDDLPGCSILWPKCLIANG